MDQWLETKQLPVHFVSAAGVVYQDGKVLLIRSERRGWVKSFRYLSVLYHLFPCVSIRFCKNFFSDCVPI